MLVRRRVFCFGRFENGMNRAQLTIRSKPNALEYRRVFIWLRWKRVAVSVGGTLAIMLGAVLFAGYLKPNGMPSFHPSVVYSTMVIMPVLLIAVNYWGIRRSPESGDKFGGNHVYV